MRSFLIPSFACVLVACGFALGTGIDDPVGDFAMAPGAVIDDMNLFLITDSPVLSVTPANQNVAYTAGSTTFTVSNTGGGSLNYNATTSDTWLHIASGASGSCPPDATITVNVDAIPIGGLPRVGTITVTAGAAGSQNVTVTQPGGCGFPLQVVSSVSVKAHGTCGYYGVPSGSWEGRVPTTATQGPSRIVTVFNQSIATPVVAGNLSVSSGTIGTITVSTTTVANDTLTVNLTGIANKATFTIGYPGVAAACDINNRTTQTNCWQVIAGETSGPSCPECVLVVNTSDYVAVRGGMGRRCFDPGFNPRKDVDCSGTIDTSDYVAIRGRIDPGASLPPTCE